MKIQCIVVAPGNATVTAGSSYGAVRISIRQARRFDDLATELGRRLVVPAQVQERGLAVPGTGTLVICRPDVLCDLIDLHPATLPWVVGVDLLRGYVLGEAETHGLAAAASLVDYQSWVDGEGKRPAIYGRRDVTTQIGADVIVDPLQVGAQYARITSRRAISLPALLAIYLAALDPLLP